MRSSIAIALFVLFLSGNSAAQKRAADSLEALLKTAKADTVRITILDHLAFILAKTDPDRSDSLGKEELKLSQKLGFIKGIAGAYHNLGSLHYKTGSMDSAKMELDSSLKYYRQMNSRSGESNVMLSMGSLLQIKGDYKGSLQCFVRANALGEELGDKNVIARSLHNMGTVNMEQGTFKQALDYYERALKVKMELGDKRSIYTTISNMGITYYNLGDLDKCEEYTRKALDLCLETGDKRGSGSCYENMGNVFTMRQKYDSALVYFTRSKDIRMQLKDRKGVASSLSNMGEALRDLGRYDAALKVQEQAVQMLEELGDLNQLKNVYKMIADTYEAKGDLKMALRYNNKYIHLKDSLFSDENNKLMADMQQKYESEKKQKEIELLKKNEEVTQKDREIDRVFRNALIGGVVVLVVLAFVLLLRFREKQKSNRELSEKNRLIEESSAKLQVAFAEIEEKNKDITDSIRYAKRIQDALLPAAEAIRTSLPDSFILFMPRNIVSGDFYWTMKSGNKTLLAVADCTGHGVPGAFMSMIGNTLLNEIVNVKRIDQVTGVLEELDKGIKHALKKESGSEATDGMDIALISLEGSTLCFAGAMRPLVMLRNGELSEWKGDKRSIGSYENAKPFTEERIPLQKGDAVYLFSDGYADQFGGDKGKKMMRKNFNELLVKIAPMDMDQQGKKLGEIMVEWKGNYEQVDDICVIGFRV